MAPISDTNGPEPRAQEVLDFWFVQTEPRLWWAKSPAFDALIASRFGDLHAAAARCELHAWRSVAQGRLAEVLVLDQFSRNLHRDRALAFANDGLALALAQTAVAAGADLALPPSQRAFLYLPFMHSESALIHAWAEPLFNAPGLEDTRAFELRHRQIIDRFGRYPHRNGVLGRPSTPEELAFLETPGSSF